LSESGSDTLPSGVTFDAAGGLLHGTPAAGSAGTYTLHFAADNGVGSPVTQTFTLTVVAPLAFTPLTLPAGSVGVAYNQTVTVSGGQGTKALSYSITGG